MTDCCQPALPTNREATYPPAERQSCRSHSGRVSGCLVLQAVGFTLPALSPTPRCALAAPFHHCLCPDFSEPSAVYFLWHFPAGRPGWPLATTVALSCSDFPPASLRNRRPPDPLFSIDYFCRCKPRYAHMRRWFVIALVLYVLYNAHRRFRGNLF